MNPTAKRAGRWGAVWAASMVASAGLGGVIAVVMHVSNIERMNRRLNLT